MMPLSLRARWPLLAALLPPVRILCSTSFQHQNTNHRPCFVHRHPSFNGHRFQTRAPHRGQRGEHPQLTFIQIIRDPQLRLPNALGDSKPACALAFEF